MDIQDLLRVMSYMFHNRHDHKVRMVRSDTDPVHYVAGVILHLLI